MKRLLLIGATALSAGCVDVVSRDASLERSASAFQSAAEACLADVRDRGVPYLSSANCGRELSRTSAAYIRDERVALTYQGKAVPRHAYVAESARATAWTAAAISNARHRQGEPVLSLW